MTTPWVWGYSDRLSARPGDEGALHLAGTGKTCDVEIARVGAERRVLRKIEGVALAPHAVPERPHVEGCGWPETVRFTIPADWPSGYYDIVLTGPVRGLSRGSQVRFNGIDVGEVINLSLDQADPTLVIARAAVTSDIPIRADSFAHS